MSVLNPPEAAAVLPRGDDPPSPPAPPRVGKTTASPPHTSVHQGPWRPWHGRPRRRDVMCCLMIGVSAVYAIATIPLTPELIASHPVLLELLSGSNSAIVAAGSFAAVHGKARLIMVVGAALPGMLRFDWVIWWAGRLWGRRVVEKLGNHSPRTAAMVAAAERQGTRFARPAVLLSALMPVSGAPVYAAAGWVGLPLITFVILDAIGCAAWATVLAICGYLLGARGVAAADLVARYAFASIAVLLVLAIVPHLWHARQTRRRSPHPAGPDGFPDHLDFSVNTTETSM
jgi:membrane protein DedA with SNARE-associated domain